MEVVLLIAMLVQSAIGYVFMRKLLEQVMAKHSEEGTRLALFARDAMESLRSKSVEEKVKADALRKEYDVRLEMYRDTVAREVAAKKAEKPPEPQYVITDDGQKIDPADVEWFDA